MRNFKKNMYGGLAAGLLLLGASQAASAATTNLSGTFAADDSIAWVDFSLTQSTLFNAYTTSFASGGFAPVLSLFSLDGGQDLLSVALGSVNACGAPGAGGASGGLCWDAFFSTDIGAGNYRLVISQDGNTPLGGSFADGFAQAGNAHYTSINYLGNDSQNFVNFDRTLRDGHYAFSMNVAAVPEPAQVLTLLLGLVVLAGAASRKKNQPFA